MNEPTNTQAQRDAAEARPQRVIPEGRQDAVPGARRRTSLCADALGNDPLRPRLDGGPASSDSRGLGGPSNGSTAIKRRKLVLVGNGMAGMRAIEELLALEP